jgi:hypothetical protein
MDSKGKKPNPTAMSTEDEKRIKDESIALHHDIESMGTSTDSWEIGFREGAKYEHNYQRARMERYAQEQADRQSVELLEWVRERNFGRGNLSMFWYNNMEPLDDYVEPLDDSELLAKFHENKKKV